MTEKCNHEQAWSEVRVVEGAEKENGQLPVEVYGCKCGTCNEVLAFSKPYPYGAMPKFAWRELLLWRGNPEEEVNKLLEASFEGEPSEKISDLT